MRESFIPLPAGDRFVAIRASFLPICEQDDCAAALLNEFRLIYDVRMDRGEPEWFTRPIAHWREALFGHYGETKIREALRHLADLGFVESRTAESGNHQGTMYRVEAEAIRVALAAYEATTAKRPCLVADRPKTEAHPPQRYAAPPQNYGGPLQKQGGSDSYIHARVRTSSRTFSRAAASRFRGYQQRSAAIGAVCCCSGWFFQENASGHQGTRVPINSAR